MKKKTYSDEYNEHFLASMAQRYAEVNGSHGIEDEQSGKVDNLLFCQQYFLRYKTTAGLAENTRDAKHMIDMMYKVISRHYTAQLEGQLMAGQEIEASIEQYSCAVSQYLQKYKHRNLVRHWRNKFTAKYVEMLQRVVPVQHAIGKKHPRSP